MMKETLGEIDTIGEKALWQSVVMQAAIDVTSDPVELKDRIERAKTIAWFSLQNEDFLLVCSFAELDPQMVIQKIRVAIKNSKNFHKKRRAKKTRNRRLSLQEQNKTQTEITLNA